jgi:thiosulfate dehydrogenase [quinone] large subunit
MWVQNLNWKIPPDFGRDEGGGLYGWVRGAVDRPVLAPYSWIVEHLVLPHFVVFGYLTLLTEFALGVFLMVGLLTRLWALVGIAQTLAITFSVLNTPHEWHWTYYLMLIAHLVLLATAAGRAHGLDGVFRPNWRHSDARLARLAVMSS